MEIIGTHRNSSNLKEFAAANPRRIMSPAQGNAGCNQRVLDCGGRAGATTPLSPANPRSLPTKTVHPAERPRFSFSVPLLIIFSKVIGIDWNSPEPSVIHQTSRSLPLPTPGTSCRLPKATPAATSVFWTAVAERERRHRFRLPTHAHCQQRPSTPPNALYLVFQWPSS